MSHSLSRLAFALQDDVLDFRIVRANEKLWAVEAHAPENFDRLHHEAGVENWLGKVLWLEIKIKLHLKRKNIFNDIESKAKVCNQVETISLEQLYKTILDHFLLA